MGQLKKIADFVQSYWLLLGILGGGLTTVATGVHSYIIMPEINGVIDSRVVIMFKDSAGVIIDRHLTSKGGGFRGGLSDTTKIPKDKLVSVLGAIMIEEGDKEKRIIELENELDYQKGFNKFLLKTLYQKVNYGPVTFYQTAAGDFKYLDLYGYLWDAAYNAADDCFYFYPNYANGQRLKCE